MSKIRQRLGKVSVLLFFAVGLIFLTRQTARLQTVTDPTQPGTCTVESQTVNVNGDLETHIYYPDGDQCGDGTVAPYPAIAFAHGFSMFGLTDGAADNAGHGEHLASWGYVVAIPRLPDDVKGRITDMQEVLAYLEAETNTPGSFLCQKVDTDRLAVAGHSFGGATVLALAAQDTRVKAVVALDPVYHQGGPGENPEIWDPDVEGPNITVPTCILGAPSSNCNSEADYEEIYPVIGATHKALFFIAGASHCDFSDPGNPLCSLVCDGDMDSARTRLVQKYMTAWFNYYVHYDTGYYDYLYGPEADGDIANGLIERQVDTAPRNVAATGRHKAVLLEWTLYDHPMVAGYNAYRRQTAEAYPDVPQIHAGPRNSYLDGGLAGEKTYFYVLCSRDAAGQEHQLSSEVSATTLDIGENTLYLPCIFRDWYQ